MKHRNTSESDSVLTILQKSSDPQIKRRANATLRERHIRASRLNVEDISKSNPTEEILLNLFRKQRGKARVDDLSPYLNKINERKELLNSMLRALESPDIKYQKWVLSLIENPRYTKAMGLKSDEALVLLEEALRSPHSDIRKAGLKIAKNNDLIPATKAMGTLHSHYVHSSKDGFPLIDSFFDTYKTLLTRNPSSQAASSLLINLTRDNRFIEKWNSFKPETKVKVSHSLRLMSRSSAEQVVASVHQNIGKHRPKIMRHILIGSSIHRSPKIAHISNSYKDAPDPVLRRVSKRLSKNKRGVVKRVCVSLSEVLKSLGE